jgi:hypothetical protein
MELSLGGAALSRGSAAAVVGPARTLAARAELHPQVAALPWGAAAAVDVLGTGAAGGAWGRAPPGSALRADGVEVRCLAARAGAGRWALARASWASAADAELLWRRKKTDAEREGALRAALGDGRANSVTAEVRVEAAPGAGAGAGVEVRLVVAWCARSRRGEERGEAVLARTAAAAGQAVRAAAAWTAAGAVRGELQAEGAAAAAGAAALPAPAGAVVAGGGARFEGAGAGGVLRFERVAARAGAGGVPAAPPHAAGVARGLLRYHGLALQGGCATDAEVWLALKCIALHQRGAGGPGGAAAAAAPGGAGAGAAALARLLPDLDLGARAGAGAAAHQAAAALPV